MPDRAVARRRTQAAKTDGRLQVSRTPAFMTAFVAFNSQKKPLDNPQVRQALNLAFDKANYLKTVFGNTAGAASLVYPPNTWSYDKAIKPYAYDPAQAKKLLAQAGYPTASTPRYGCAPAAAR